MPARLSVELADLARAFENCDVSIRQIMDRLQGRVYTLLLVLFSLPFCQPIALPGLSTPFGVVIALFGLRFAFRQKPWLPAKIQDLKIPARFLPRVMQAGSWILGILEKLLHPRMGGVFDLRATQFVCGMTICICGILLLLPLPIPFSNILPAMTILLVAASVSERDGVMLGVAGVMFFLTLLFFAAIFIGGAEAAIWIKEHFAGYFEPGEELLPLPPGFEGINLTPSPSPTPR